MVLLYYYTVDMDTETSYKAFHIQTSQSFMTAESDLLKYNLWPTPPYVFFWSTLFLKYACICWIF